MAKKCPSGTYKSGNHCRSTSKSFFSGGSSSGGMDLRRMFLWSAIFAIVITALIASWAVLFGEFSEQTLKILATTGIVAAIGLLGFASEGHENQTLRFLGLGTAIFAGVMWLGLVWEMWEFSSEGVLKTTIIASLVAFATAQTSLLSLKGSSNSMVKGLFFATLGFIIAFNLMIIYAILINFEIANPEMFVRILIFLGILDVAGSVALPVMRRIKG